MEGETWVVMEVGTHRGGKYEEHRCPIVSIVGRAGRAKWVVFRVNMRCPGSFKTLAQNGEDGQAMEKKKKKT